jgi:hypothetical protein
MSVAMPIRKNATPMRCPSSNTEFDKLATTGPRTALKPDDIKPNRILMTSELASLVAPRILTSKPELIITDTIITLKA